MGRYWKLYRTFFRTSFARELEFRANFFAKIFGNLMWLGFFLLFLLVVYSRVDAIAGWNRGDAIVLTASVFLLSSINAAFFMSVSEIPQQVRLGTLDFIVTKPIDSQFWVSSRRFNFDQVGTVFAGVVLLLVGVHQSGATPGGLQWLAYAASLLSAVVLFYSFNLALMTTGIWLVRVENLWVLSESVADVARFPTSIYPLMLQQVFLYYVPLALVATVPSRQLLERADLGLFGVSAGWALLAFVLARQFWRFAMTRYTSASS